MATTIFIADDHKVFRESLRLLLSQQSDFCVVADNAGIGRELRISARTVETHRAQKAKPDHV